MKNKRIFITGGAGYLGKNLIERLYNDNEIVCFSRDEAKHYLLKKKYPKIKCVVGDIESVSGGGDCFILVVAESGNS